MTKTRTTTVIRTRTEADVALRQAGLSSEQEKVLRMRYGIPLDEAVALQRHEAAQPEVAAQLREMEQRNWSHLSAADAGFAMAKVNLGLCRLNGWGVSRDEQAAFRALLAQGDDALDRIDELEARKRVLDRVAGNARNEEKARRLYAAIDGSGGFYRNEVALRARSRMNVPFQLPEARLDAEFLKGARPQVSQGHISPGTVKRFMTMARERGLDQDPIVRQRLADLYTRVQVIGWSAKRAKGGAGGRTGVEGPLAKIAMTEALRRGRELGCHLLGPDAQLWGPEAATEGWLQELTVFSPGPSIYGGTDEIQRNIIGERGLGLPKEPGPARDTPFKDLPANAIR